jgi:hypothetical protein
MQSAHLATSFLSLRLQKCEAWNQRRQAAHCLPPAGEPNIGSANGRGDRRLVDTYLSFQPAFAHDGPHSPRTREKRLLLWGCPSLTATNAAYVFSDATTPDLYSGVDRTCPAVARRQNAAPVGHLVRSEDRGQRANPSTRRERHISCLKEASGLRYRGDPPLE